MKLGLSLSITRRGGGSAPAITAVEFPRILPAQDGDTLAVAPANWNLAANYLPPGSTVTASSLTINGTAAAVGDPLAEGDVAALSVTVQATVDGGVVTRTFTATITVAALPALGNALWGTSEATWGGVPAAWGDAA